MLASYEGLNYSDLSPEYWVVYDEATSTFCDKPIAGGGRSRPCIDYRKPAAFNRHCAIVQAYKNMGSNGIFVDALYKTAGIMQGINDDTGARDSAAAVQARAEYLAGYYAFLTYARDVHAGGISVVNARPFNSLPAIINAPIGASGGSYSTFEGMANALVNGLCKDLHTCPSM